VTPDRELRVVAIQIDGLGHVQVGYWRRKGPVLLAIGGQQVVIDGRHLDALIRDLEDARKTLAALRGDAW
jgi:hypothetical protein